MKKTFVLLLLTTTLSAQTFSVRNDRAVDLVSGEGQSTVVAPGINGDCPFGRFITSSDVNPGHEGVIAYRDLGGDDTATHISKFRSGPSPTDYSFGTSDHDLVSLSNGEIYYLTGVLTRSALSTKPAWWASAYRWDFGPGARGSLIVWRSRDCGKSFEYVPELEFDSAKIDDGSCALPQNAARYRHDQTASAHYVVPVEAYAQPGDSHFRYCTQCKQLFYLDPAQPTACPLGGPHVDGGGVYKVTQGAVTGHVTETGFRRCNVCGTLYRATAAHTACAGQMTHDGTGSPEYFVATSSGGWHRCTKCQALFNDSSTGLCPVGGRHAAAGTYAMQVPAAGVLNTQTDWHRCTKCNGLYLGHQSANVCPSGGTHQDEGVTYMLFTSKPDPQKIATEGGWRRCKYCGQLFKGDEQKNSACPLVRPHQPAASTYTLARENATDPAELQPEWRVCDKCGSVYFSHYADTFCPISAPQETKIYDMGGQDGQVVHADPITNRMYLTFRCVGRLQDKAFTEFTLSNTFLGKTYVAVSESGAPWSIAGVLPYNLWRTEVATPNAGSITLGFNDTMVHGDKFATGWKFTPQTPFAAKQPAKGWENFDRTDEQYANIVATMWNHSVVARTPDTNRNTIFVMPDTIPNRGHGYRLFFYDRATNSFADAAVPILPLSHTTGDAAFHLQAIDIGKGPVLLVWNDYRVDTKQLRIRGRFVIGEHRYTTDFDIATENGTVRILDAKPKTGYGDYQTSSGYAASSTTFVYHPMWIEPPNGAVHFGTVVYNAAAPAVPGTILTAMKAP